MLYMQELSTAAGHVDSDMGSLQAQVHDLKKALAAADQRTQAKCQSIAAQWQARLDARAAELLAVQEALQSELESVRAHAEETCTTLELSARQVSQEKQAHTEDAAKWTAQLAAERKNTVDAANRAASHQHMIQAKDSEIKMLHDQVRRFRQP